MELHYVRYCVIISLYQTVNALLPVSVHKSGLNLSYTVTDYNLCMEDEFRLQVYHGRHLDDCITECAIRPHCLALTYHQYGFSSLCELFKSGATNSAKRDGCIYIEKNDIIIEQVPCEAECAIGTTCNMETGSCDHTECINLPTITDGKLVGNLHGVGNKLQFVCDRGVSSVEETVCQPNGEWSVTTVNCIFPVDCKDIYDIGHHVTGVYRIYPVDGEYRGTTVRCDMDTPPGGWTVIQRRVDGTVDFYRTWLEYKHGFGDLLGSYWLGNEHIWALTSHRLYKLRVDLVDKREYTGFAEYDHFSISNETYMYTLNIGEYHGTVGNGFAYHNQMKFSTKDYDNDYKFTDGGSCSLLYHGGWWYNSCHHSNLNGEYNNNNYGQGVMWSRWRGQFESLNRVEMKVYPIDTDVTQGKDTMP